MLYKNPNSNVLSKQEIKVIDPSNFIYSSHLKNLQGNDYFKQLQSIKPFIIETKHATLPIYKHETINHRDCVDIAVKIALTLTGSKEIIKLDEIEKSEMFRLLSNQSMITSKQNPVLIKQTSSTDTVKAFNKIEEVVEETLKNFRLIKSIKSDIIEKEHNDILVKSTKDSLWASNKDIIKELLDFNNKYANEFAADVNAIAHEMIQKDTNLAGEINITKHEYI